MEMGQRGAPAGFALPGSAGCQRGSGGSSSASTGVSQVRRRLGGLRAAGRSPAEEGRGQPHSPGAPRQARAPRSPLSRLICMALITAVPRSCRADTGGLSAESPPAGSALPLSALPHPASPAPPPQLALSGCLRRG